MARSDRAAAAKSSSSGGVSGFRLRSLVRLPSFGETRRPPSLLNPTSSGESRRSLGGGESAKGAKAVSRTGARREEMLVSTSAIRALTVAFVASGAAGLIFELVWFYRASLAF